MKAKTHTYKIFKSEKIKQEAFVICRNHPLETTNLLSVCMTFIIDIFHKWNPIAFGILCLASFIYYNAIEMQLEK